MSRVVTPRKLAIVLRELGFLDEIKSGKHVAFRHKGTGLVVIVPTGVQAVPLVHLRAIETQLENFKIAEPNDFEDRLELRTKRNGPSVLRSHLQ
jgi:predicted RNA binding protein YcfA (HicA-like mRNA interferase family)